MFRYHFVLCTREKFKLLCNQDTFDIVKGLFELAAEELNFNLVHFEGENEYVYIILDSFDRNLSPAQVFHGISSKSSAMIRENDVLKLHAKPSIWLRKHLESTKKFDRTDINTFLLSL